MGADESFAIDDSSDKKDRNFRPSSGVRNIVLPPREKLARPCTKIAAGEGKKSGKNLYKIIYCSSLACYFMIGGSQSDPNVGKTLLKCESEGEFKFVIVF